jgi:hypothetical protein
MRANAYPHRIPTNRNSPRLIAGPRQTIRPLEEGLRDGRVIPFVGAGVSMAVERVALLEVGEQLPRTPR